MNIYWLGIIDQQKIYDKYFFVLYFNATLKVSKEATVIKICGKIKIAVRLIILSLVGEVLKIAIKCHKIYSLSLLSFHN